MLSYQHGYHAGNFADVVKHIALTQIINYMTIKNKPLFYLETHAGKGRYDLQDEQALKTGEAQEGIGLLFKNRQQLPEVFSSYLHVISQFNEKNTLRYYPGSPSFAIHLLRPQDRLFLCELHPHEFSHLKKLPHQGKRVFFGQNDGLTSLQAMLPPPEKRGLIFIDPSYEIKTDYKEIPKLLHKAYLKFPSGVYCVWYPLLDQNFHAQLLKGLTQIKYSNHLQVEFDTGKDELGMTGCGLWIINPPYVLKEELNVALDKLCKLFNPKQSSYFIAD